MNHIFDMFDEHIELIGDGFSKLCLLNSRLEKTMGRWALDGRACLFR